MVFMPVGVNYAAWLLLLLAMLAYGKLRERFVRLRTSALFWPLAAYVGWTLIVLAVGPHYPETGQSTGHGLRIAMTIAMALVLTHAEAISALRGFLVAAIFGVALIALTYTVGLPDLQIWHAIVSVTGNKSINNALLFTLLGALAAAFAMSALHDWRHRYWRIFALVVTGCTLFIITAALPSRTSLLALLIAVLAACIHQWRRQIRPLVIALAATLSVAAAMTEQAPSVQQKFALGLHEIEQANAGVASENSWGARYYMYTTTTRMMLEKPLFGWGIGAWTSEWHRRTPPVLHDYNMPHNDFLWMGAQAGIPGFLALFSIVATSLVICWRRRDLIGRMGFITMLVLLFASCLNSVMRDAAIGLSLPWIAFVVFRLAQDPKTSLRQIQDVRPMRFGSPPSCAPQ